jgi:3-oxoacyl-[acyl-carrier protein] reductase
VRDLIAFAASKFGGLSTLVNNASGGLVPKPFADLAADDLLQHLQTQFLGAFHLVQEALPYLEKVENPAVVNIGSIATDNVPPMNLMPYVAAKAALASMTKSLAVEYGHKGIRFNNVFPGMTDTLFIANMPEKARMLTRMQTPLRRLANASDIAEAVAFLVSSKARHITGETLRVCGGTVMV